MAVLEKKPFCVDSFLAQKSADPNKSNWIVLGHFDFLSIEKLNIQGNFFETIYYNNKKLLSSPDSNCYCYPLYLLSDNNDSDFEKKFSAFSAIIKVHFSSTIDHLDRFSELKKVLDNNLADSEKIKYEVYHTLELSDAIIIIKADYLSELLTVVATLRSCLFVGKIYTYPAISTIALKNERLFKENDIIDYLSLRFSLQHPFQSSLFIPKLKKALKANNIYSVTGVDDFLLEYRNASAKDIYNIYNNLFVIQSRETFPLSSLITRIGLSVTNIDPLSENDEPKESLLFPACSSVLLAFEKIKDTIECQKYEWVGSLFELIKLLSRMSKSPVLDEFVYLLLPGMISFINNLKAISSNQDLLDSFSYEYNDFVQGLTDLIEQIMRSEIQLAHNPELRPIMYHLPIVMLEYTQAFLRKCSDFLKRHDPTNENIQLLLVPKIVNRLETVEIFPPSKETDGLIQISIPLDMLYNPSQLQCNLCHEISHFIGEHHRNRDSRITYYSKAVSILMSKLLFNDFSHSRITAINEQLSERLHAEKTQDGKCRIRQMQTVVEQWIEGLCSDQEEYCAFIHRLLEAISANERIKIIGDIDTIHYLYSKYFSHLLEQIGRLFKEIYADICMLFLLPIASEEYLKQFSDELNNENADYPLDDIDDASFRSQLYEIYSIRMYVSLVASNNYLPCYTESDPNYYKRICDNLHEIDKAIHLEDEIDSYIPTGVIIQLLQYAKDCYSSFQKSGSSPLFDMVFENNNIDYNKLLKYIDDHRKILLKDFYPEI